MTAPDRPAVGDAARILREMYGLEWAASLIERLDAALGQAEARGIARAAELCALWAGECAATAQAIHRDGLDEAGMVAFHDKADALDSAAFHLRALGSPHA